MINKNQYYELAAKKIAVVDSEEVVNSQDSVVWSLDKTKFICKTKENIIASGVMNPHTALTQEEAKVKVRSLDYAVEDGI